MYRYQPWQLATSFLPLHVLWDWQNMILPSYSKYWQRWPDWTIDISPWVNPGDSHLREWAFLLLWLVVSHMPAMHMCQRFRLHIFRILTKSDMMMALDKWRRPCQHHFTGQKRREKR